MICELEKFILRDLRFEYKYEIEYDTDFSVARFTLSLRIPTHPMDLKFKNCNRTQFLTRSQI